MDSKDLDPLTELKVRRGMALLAVNILKDMIGKDPRAEGALEKYMGQLDKIDEKIAKLTGKAPDVIVGLRTASLSGKTK